MKRIAPWLVAVAGIALLAAGVVLLALARGGAPGDENEGRAILDRLTALENTDSRFDRKLLGLGSDLAALQNKMDDVAAMPDGVRAELDRASKARPPKGHVIAPFDRDLGRWVVPEWASGGVRHATRPGMFRRGKGALALGYTYGEKVPAAVGPVQPNGKVRILSLYARTRVREVTFAVGVVEEGGARYEVRVPSLKPEQGWRLVSVAPAAMGLVPGSRDAVRGLDLAKITAVYVADRTQDAAGGNVILVDDVAVELMPSARATGKRR